LEEISIVYLRNLEILFIKIFKKHIKIIQEVYQEMYLETLQPMIIDKEKQKENIVQDKEIFFHKPYAISESSKLKTPELVFIANLRSYI